MSTNFLDLGNILRQVYEPASESLRVNAVIAPPAGTEVIISHLDDSIALGNGVSLYTSTTVGPKVGLDVAIINPIDVSLSHITDSVALGNGTDLYTSTTIGAKTAIDVAVISEPDVASTPQIDNVSAPLSGTEYSFSVPLGTKKLHLKSRLSGKLQFAFVSGQSGTNFITIPPGSVYPLDSISTTSALTLYVQSTKTGDTFEIITWA